MVKFQRKCKWKRTCMIMEQKHFGQILKKINGNTQKLITFSEKLSKSFATNYGAVLKMKIYNFEEQEYWKMVWIFKINVQMPVKLKLKINWVNMEHKTFDPFGQIWSFL